MVEGDHGDRWPDERGPLLDLLDDALVGIRRAVQLPGYRRRASAALDIPLELGTLRALRAVERSAEPPSIGDIAADLAIDPSAASRLIDRCADRGLVERHTGTVDRRKVRIKLTGLGRALLDQATERRREMLAEVTERWPTVDLRQLVVLLDALRAGFLAMEDPPAAWKSADATQETGLAPAVASGQE